MKLKKNKRLKQLLHNQSQKKKFSKTRLEHHNDQLHFRFATMNMIKKNGLNSALNSIRRINAKEELNQVEHNSSKHIRLQPYYEAQLPIHWVGIISDTTIPQKKEQTEGAILIDKITTEDHQELIDYHLWLNVVNIKFLQSSSGQQVGIGDYIEGISLVNNYSHDKYGLGPTVIVGCGIYTGEKKEEKLISTYNRGDDWVLKLTNSTASERARDEYLRSNFSLTKASAISGHVTCTYQPSRYSKFQNRLSHTDEKEALTLIPETMENYVGIIGKVYAANINDEYVPMLGLQNIYNSHHRRVINNIDVPYPQELMKLGLVTPGQKIVFRGAYHDGDFDFEDIRIEGSETLTKIPTDSKALAGYLLELDHPDLDLVNPAGRACIEAYMNWTHHNQSVAPVKAKPDHKPVENTNHNPASKWDVHHYYSGEEVAQILSYPPIWTENMVEQKFLIPSNPKASLNEMKFAGSEIEKVYQIKLANTDAKASFINKSYHFYRAKDIARLLKISLSKVINIIGETNYHSFNKFYGQNVFDLVKEKIQQESEVANKMKQTKANELLNKYATNRSGVVIKREIPQNKEIKFDKPAASVKPKAPVAKIENQEVAPKVQSASAEKKAVPVEKAQPDDQNLRIILTTMTGEYCSQQFASQQEAQEYFEKPLALNELNRFVDAYDVRNQEVKHLSVRSILEWRVE